MIDIHNKQQVKKLQKFLDGFGYNPKGIDGIVGNNTITALTELLRDVKEPKVVINIPKSKEDVIGDIIITAGQQNFSNEQIAYILATVKHETGDTFQPVREAYWLSEQWRKKNLRYYGKKGYYGRGYVQITWEANYEKFAKLTGEDLVNQPDLALRHDIALFILLYGFKMGTFTGRKISDYINDDKTDYYNARRCINGVDKARLIASYAENFYSGLFK
jgi:predicted chitinase